MMPTKLGSNQESTHVVRERYRLCPSCGNFAGLSERQSYCMMCGATLIDKCPGCNEPILYPTARFCPLCGIPLIESLNNSPPKGNKKRTDL
jgi:predicted amidophosphoribosyltransferase